MPIKHAKLSASSADRWIHCPGSIQLSEKCPKPKDTIYTVEGTEAHTLADIRVREMVHGDSILTAHDKAERRRIMSKSEFYSAEMDAAADTYAELIAEIYRDAGRGAVLMTEQRLNLTKWIPDGFGTSDAVVIGNDTIWVIDFKYGKGIAVSAQDNPQIQLYALGAIDKFDGLYDFNKVQMIIVQPRLNSISSQEKTVTELEKWAEEVVRPQAVKAMDGCKEYHAGEWCKFCPCHPICQEEANLQQEIAKHDFRDPELMDSDDVAAVLEIADKYVSWVNALKEYALRSALDGEVFRGWKVVEGRSTRSYLDELKVADKLKAAGFEDALIYERKLLGVTAMEKVVGKKAFAEILGDLVYKPEGKPVLVPESDKREPLDKSKLAKQDFEKEE